MIERMQFEHLALSLSAWGKKPTKPKTLCSRWDTFKQKPHRHPEPHTSSKPPSTIQLSHTSSQFPQPPSQKAALCKAALLRFFRSAYHPHSIDQGFRYLRNDCLQCGGLSFPMPMDDLCPSLNKYIYPDTGIPHHAPYSIKAMS